MNLHVQGGRILRTYTTSEFCKLCGVSRKQLRYYEERGIISDVGRDENNNYRAYSMENIYEVVAAKALRNINMPVSDMRDIIFGKNVNSLRMSLEDHLDYARENLELSIQMYQQSVAAYARLSEALAYLKQSQKSPEILFEYEVMERNEQMVVAVDYEADFEDDGYEDVAHLPQIQDIADTVNAISFGSLIYVTYDHFDSSVPAFNEEIHKYHIAVPVLDRKKASHQYMKIPAFRGLSAIHIGTPKNGRLVETYMGLMNWAKKNGHELGDWSVEEWLISPMITNNKNLWVIQILIPSREYDSLRPVKLR